MKKIAAVLAAAAFAGLALTGCEKNAKAVPSDKVLKIGIIQLVEHPALDSNCKGFIDGLGDLIYNCGERGVTLSVFWERLQKCRYDRNEPGFINKNDLNFTIAGVKTSRISAKGHVPRRYDAHKMMLN